MSFIKKVLKLLLPLLVIDLIFVSIAFETVSNTDYLRYFLFDLGLSLLVCFLTSKCKRKTVTIINFVVVLVLSIFAILELQFKSFLDTFYTFKAVGGGFAAVTNFAGIFIRTIDPSYYFVLISLLLVFVLSRMKVKYETKFDFKVLIASIVCFVLCFVSINKENENIKNAYKYRNNYDLVFKTLGTNAFFFNDIYYLTQEIEEEQLVIEVNEPEEEVQEEIIVEETPKKREFDDAKWRETIENETDETIKTIDEYLINRPIEQVNEMTGIYEGKNFIYFMIEAFDYVAIDPVLTPTLYKMFDEGRSYLNHYTPIYSCGTGDSEYVGMTGTYPLVTNCTLYSTDIDNHQSLAGLFKNEGYTVKSFHNWTDEFYPRTKVHLQYGFEEYLDFDGLGITALEGWLSDLELVQKALPHFVDEDHFFALLVTSAMHYPYDYPTTLGDRYLAQVQAVHPDYPIEVQRYLSKSMDFDKGLEYLLKTLEEKGILEDTVIGLYGDHAPKTIPLDTIYACSKVMNRNVPYGQFKQPFILYNAGDETEKNEMVCGSLDNLPTIANMFNLDYDPRLYAGSDIYNGNATVKFVNGDWISNYGRYSSGVFYPINEDVPESYFEKTNNDIVNIKKVNQAMLRSNYYANRRFVINHQKGR